MRTLNVTFNDDDFEELQSIKGQRTWREAILQEFKVNLDD